MTLKIETHDCYGAPIIMRVDKRQTRYQFRGMTPWQSAGDGDSFFRTNVRLRSFAASTRSDPERFSYYMRYPPDREILVSEWAFVAEQLTAEGLL